MSKHKPFILIGPGDVIRDELEYYGWGEKNLAELIDISEKHVIQLLNNELPITPEIASKLSRVFKQSPQFWINLYSNFCKRKDDY